MGTEFLTWGMAVTPYNKAAELWHPRQMIQENQTREYQW